MKNQSMNVTARFEQIGRWERVDPEQVNCKASQAEISSEAEGEKVLAGALERIRYFLSRNELERASALLELVSLRERELRGDALYQYARIAAMLIGLGESRRLFERYCEENPQEACGWCSLGDMHRYTGRHEQALEAYALALEREPEHYWATLWSGSACLRSGKLVQALRWFEKLKRDHPLEPAGYLKLSQVFTVQGKAEQARVYFLAGLILNSNAAPEGPLEITPKSVRENLAHLKPGELFEAIKMISECEEAAGRP